MAPQGGAALKIHRGISDPWIAVALVAVGGIYARMPLVSDTCPLPAVAGVGAHQ